MQRHLTIIAFVILSSTISAQAQKIRAADTGAVDLLLDGVSDVAPITIKKGDTLWVEGFRPDKVKVLIDPVENRIRPNTSGVAAGTPLIGVSIASGTAYCPVIDYDAPSNRVQCFQDLDNDGLFDGGYYTDQRGFDTQFLSGWLRGLAGLAPKIAYTDANEETPIPTGKVTFQFDSIRKGTPRFWLYIEQERVSDKDTCDVIEPGVCVLFGRTLKFTENDDNTVTFTPLEPVGPRLLTYRSSSSYRK